MTGRSQGLFPLHPQLHPPTKGKDPGNEVEKKATICLQYAFIDMFYFVSSAICVLGEAAETIWRQVNMAIVNRRFVLLQLTTGALSFLLKKPFYL